MCNTWQAIDLELLPAPQATTLYSLQEKKMGTAMEFTDANFQQEVLNQMCRCWLTFGPLGVDPAE